MHFKLYCNKKSPKVNLTYLYRAVTAGVYRYQGDRILYRIGTGSRDNWKLNMNFLLLGFFCMLLVRFFFLQVWSILNKIYAESQKFLERKRKGEPD